MNTSEYIQKDRPREIRKLLSKTPVVMLNILFGQYFHFMKVLKKMREIIGFPGGDSILAPGGSISNMYALLCARHKYFPDFKNKGASKDDTIAIYTSAQVLYILQTILRAYW